MEVSQILDVNDCSASILDFFLKTESLSTALNVLIEHCANVCSSRTTWIGRYVYSVFQKNVTKILAK